MELERLKPTSAGMRHQVNIKKYLLSKNSNICKILSIGKKQQNGRSSITGHITVWHKGGGVKKKIRNMNYFPDKNYSIQIATFYNAKSTSFVSLCYNFLQSKFYNTLSTNNTYSGSLIFAYRTCPEFRLGTSSQLKNIPTGTIIHSISNFSTVKYIKAAGTFGVILQKDVKTDTDVKTDVKIKTCKVKMPSGAIKDFPLNFYCTIGYTSNHLHNLAVIGKAGRSRLKGIRPHVRGVAMNPVDHPHGGQTSGGCPSVTPWGIPTKGKPTKKKYVKS
jgi:large subunit ribosomal protein L2